jgi:hypothetical protein
MAARILAAAADDAALVVETGNKNDADVLRIFSEERSHPQARPLYRPY